MTLPPEEINARQGFALSPDQRESMEYDVLIVGAGPAGLAAAIQLKQIAKQQKRDISVCILEKGSEVGAHILSGAVIDPEPLTQLIPEWKEKGAPLQTPAEKERFLFLTQKRAFPIPNFLLPPLMKNHGNYIISLGSLCRWLAKYAENLGVEIYPGFAAAEILFNDDKSVKGVATGDMGLAKDLSKKDAWQPGMEIHAKYTLLAEGARGSLSKFLIKHFSLDENADPQKYGIGLKELWKVSPDKHKPGLVQHSLGWPLGNATGGGSFIYHFGDNLVALGLVVHLDYANPYLSPFHELQKFKTHPAIQPLLLDAERISYGARAITSGGAQSIPKLVFPGGALIGCAAGFVNVPRIKGSHNAIATGILAANAAADALKTQRKHDTLSHYQNAYNASPVSQELQTVRNVKPLWSRFQLLPGLLIAGLDMWMRTLRIGLPFTLKHAKPDHLSLKTVQESKPISYPKPDGKITFDKPSSVYLSGTNHEENQPAHLTLADKNIPIERNLPQFDEPAQRYCPAGVYEIIQDPSGQPRFQINPQNCVHCKTCDIKDPAQNINWIVPEGGGGPNYSNM